MERDKDRREPTALRKADDGMERSVLRRERRNVPHRRRDILTHPVLVRIYAPVRIVRGRADGGDPSIARLLLLNTAGHEAQFAACAQSRDQR